MRSKIVIFSLIVLLISRATIVSASAPQPVMQSAIPTAAPTPTPLTDTVCAQIDLMDQAMTNLYQRISPSVVHVTTQNYSQLGIGIGSTHSY